MPTPEQRIVDKFSELVERSHTEGGIHQFSAAERAVWFIVSIRCEMDIGDFISVFEQFLLKAEVLETSDYLNALDCMDEAQYFDEVLELLDEHSFYGDDGRPAVAFSALPEGVRNRVDEIGEMLEVSNILWNLDDRLCEALDMD